MFSFQLSVGIENGNLESYNSDFELQFSHPLKHIVGMCRLIHRPNQKSTGNGFVQLKPLKQSNSVAFGQQNTSNNGNTGTSNGFRQTLTTSTSHGSLSASAAAAYHIAANNVQQANAEMGGNIYGAGNGVGGGNSNGGGRDAASNPANMQNFMEFVAPITGLVYLMKNPKDPLLHIYLFECDTLEEVSFNFNCRLINRGFRGSK